MIPDATLHLINRLVTALMTLVAAVAPGAAATTPNLSEAAAQSLFFRLGQLVIYLIRISNFGIRARPNRKPATQAPAPAAHPRRPTGPNLAASLPRRPGWLLAALPEIAPAIAADIGALLADPAIAALLDSAPSLHRTLRPLLRSLGLGTAPPSPQPPRPPVADHGATQRQTVQPGPATPNPPPHRAESRPPPLHAQFITI